MRQTFIWLITVAAAGVPVGAMIGWLGRRRGFRRVRNETVLGEAVGLWLLGAIAVAMVMIFAAAFANGPFVEPY